MTLHVNMNTPQRSVVVPKVQGLLNPQHPEPAEST